jgi:hypothetical protein
MPKSKRSEADQVLEGEVLPPAHISIASVAEMTPEQFLALHGIKPPKPKSYPTLRAAMAAIVTEVAEAKP